MTKILFFLLLLTAFSLTSLWFIENDGNVVIEWLGYRVQTSVAFSILFLIVTICIVTLLVQFILWLKSAPKNYSKFREQKKRNRGFEALTKGFAALYIGDMKQAKSLSAIANNNLKNIPLTKLLAAQTAQLEGKGEIAKEHYTAMLANKETEMVAIKGLLIEAGKDNDLSKALFLAQKAYSLQPNASWVIQILLDIYKKLKKWYEAYELLPRALNFKVIDGQKFQRDKALLSLAIYQKLNKANLDSTQDDAAKPTSFYIKSAFKLLPDFAPIVTGYAMYLNRIGKKRKAIKILEQAFKSKPHPDIASCYMNLFDELDASARINLALKLLSLSNQHIEGHLLLTSELLSNGETTKARQHLKSAMAFGETKIAAKLMAELETIEKSDYAVIHYWQKQATITHDVSVWRCNTCGDKTDIWQLNCNKCENFDSYVWQDAQQVVNIVQPVKMLE